MGSMQHHMASSAPGGLGRLRVEFVAAPCTLKCLTFLIPCENNKELRRERLPGSHTTSVLFWGSEFK